MTSYRFTLSMKVRYYFFFFFSDSNWSLHSFIHLFIYNIILPLVLVNIYEYFIYTRHESSVEGMAGLKKTWFFP